jgi:hypothetical protein
MKSVVIQVSTETTASIDYSLIKKCRGKCKEYEEYARYSSLLQAKEAIDQGIDNQNWVRSVKRSTKDGDKIYFTCAKFPKCPRSLYVLLDPDSNDAIVYVTNNDHDHEQEARAKALCPSSRAKVLELLDVGVNQPRKIIKALENSNLPVLSKVQTGQNKGIHRVMTIKSSHSIQQSN